jgi:hypothetical protein
MPKVSSYYAVQPDAPSSAEGQVAYLIDRVRFLEERLDDLFDIMTKINHSAPERPSLGRLALADGVDWDPGSVGSLAWVWWNGAAWMAL